MRIAVPGAGGQLGAAVVHELAGAHDVRPLDRAALDITDAAAVATSMTALTPDAIVNCAAYNAVDAAEENPVAALQTNALAVRSLARAAASHGGALVHCSTDFVFDGTIDRPHTEEDRPNPRSVYGASKLIGEWFAQDAPRAYVLRLESLFGRAPGGPPARGSAEAILAALREGRTARVFGDRTVSPSYLPDVARAIRLLLEQREPAGLYHCVSSGHCTWLEFAQEAARLLGVSPRLEVVRLADVPMRATRPLYCALSNAKLASVGITMPTWQESLAQYLQAE
jgi:dTDP-4-dehydrorhamnose reductase